VPRVGVGGRGRAPRRDDAAVIEEVRDGGPHLVARATAYVLSPLTAHYVRAGEPYYGVRLRLSRATIE